VCPWYVFFSFYCVPLLFLYFFLFIFLFFYFIYLRHPTVPYRPRARTCVCLSPLYTKGWSPQERGPGCVRSCRHVKRTTATATTVARTTTTFWSPDLETTVSLGTVVRRCLNQIPSRARKAPRSTRQLPPSCPQYRPRTRTYPSRRSSARVT